MDFSELIATEFNTAADFIYYVPQPYVCPNCAGYGVTTVQLYWSRPVGTLCYTCDGAGKVLL